MNSAPPKLNSLTPTQRRAVAARGNVLVMAGAGTGKTLTLVERCLDCLQPDGAAIDELLVVTFTEAAAADLRGRLHRAIESKLLAEPVENRTTAENFWAGQLARFDLAHIGTLHSFCLRLVREHFYELGLDPRLALLDEGQSRQLANETLETLFDAHYAGEDDFSRAVQDLIQAHGGGRDEEIRALVLRLHHYSQARPDAAGWLAAQRKHFATAEPEDWQRWLPAAIVGWREEWLPILENLGVASANEKAAQLAAILARLAEAGDKARPRAAWRQTAAEVLEQIVSADGHWPARRKTVLRKPLEGFFEEAEFLWSLAAVKDGRDPLAEDWSWVRGKMETLLRLAEEFAGDLAVRKRANAALDFHDLEQFALQLLWDFSTGRATAVAANWRARLKFVFVDEYQDINAAQDKIIQGLSRDEFFAGPEAAGAARENRFLVGDVKQSIYRFRLADPKIFREYARDWHGAAGQTIPLSENFRSHAALLGFVNSLFRLVMREDLGGVAYDTDAELQAGRIEMQADPGAENPSGPRTELLVRFKSGRTEPAEAENKELASLNDTQREARLVARRLQELVNGRHTVFDSERKILRPLEWRDVAILLRSPYGRTEIFAREFERAGVPLAVARGGFYQSAEVLDLLSLLQLLDNPLQDVPCLAVLRSPLVGLSLDELAEIRLAAQDKHFWTALVRSREMQRDRGTPAARKVATFLEHYSRWRQRARLVSLSQCLEEILADTLYSDWLRAQPLGAQRAANVAGFLQLAQQFDEFQRQGLFRFLKFIEAQQEADAEPEVPPLAVENAVRLMSIHQSKGLEFPVVVLADLAKRFNEQDLRGDILFDEEFGLCPKVKPPHAGGRYPSLPHWLAQRRQQRELRGEELRLLYVALTRAREQLILTASVREKNWNEAWHQTQPVSTRQIAGAKCFADWLALWFSTQLQNSASEASTPGSRGEMEHLRWRVVPDTEPGDVPAMTAETLPPTAGHSSAPSAADSEDDLGELRSRLEWIYPFKPATQRAAKSSVTALRREAEELDDEAVEIFPDAERRPRRPASGGGPRLSAADIGAAHHKFLQYVALDQTEELAEEAGRLVREGYLSAKEEQALDLDALAAFWNSPLGRKIRARPEDVRRELPFTARFRPAELAAVTGHASGPGLDDEFVIVQGVADLVVLGPRETWLVDFKTDDLMPLELPGKIRTYAPQLQLYALALEKIFGRPVSVKALHFLALDQTVEIS